MEVKLNNVIVRRKSFIRGLSAKLQFRIKWGTIRVSPCIWLLKERYPIAKAERCNFLGTQ